MRLETKTAFYQASTGMWEVSGVKMNEPEFRRLQKCYTNVRWVCFVPIGYKSRKKKN